MSLRRRSSLGGDLWERRRPELAGLVGLFIASLVGTAASGRFYPHYFIQLVLPLTLLAAPICSRILWSPAQPGPLYLRRGFMVGVLAVTVVGFTTAHAIGLYLHRSETAVGRYVREHSSPDDRMFVWGQSTGHYADARRRPASRYVATFPLTGYIFGSPLSWDPNHDTSDRIVPGSWDNLVRDFERTPPLFIIDTESARTIPKYPVEHFPVLQSILARNYYEVATLPGGTVFRRIEAPNGGEPHTSRTLQ